MNRKIFSHLTLWTTILATLTTMLLIASIAPSPTHTTQNVTCSPPYPLGYTPSAVTSVNENTILIAEKNELLWLNTTSLHVLYSLKARGDITTIECNETGMVTLVTNSHQNPTVSTIHNSEKEKIIRTFPSGTLVSLGENHLCATSIQTISSPEEIATTITIYTMTGEPYQTLASSLTLVPYRCTDPLILTPPLPLAPAIYTWRWNAKAPDLVASLKESESLLPTDTGITVITSTQDRTTQVMAYTSQNGRLVRANYGEIPYDSVTTIYQNKVHFMTGNVLITRDGTRTIRYTLTRNNTNYSDIIPLDTHRFGLISDKGELWLLECQQVHVFSLLNSIIK